jgi:hypothetical protein
MADSNYRTLESSWFGRTGHTYVQNDFRRKELVREAHPQWVGPQRHSCVARFLSPEVLEPIRCQLGITRGVLNVLVPQVGLKSPRIMPLVGQGESTGVP